MDILAEVLEKEAKKNEHYKTTDVEKHLELEFDLGNLMAIDSNDLDLQAIKSGNREAYLLGLARDNTQLLLNQLFALPTERVEEIVVAKLPPVSTVTPREKRVPRPRPLTKWEQYATEKGIKNKKKTNVNWDDVMQKWVPRFGYRRSEAEKQKDWVLEVPEHADPMEDQFAKKAEGKKEKVAKNEYQRLRNLAASKKIKLPREGLPPVEQPNASQLNAAVTVARVSTASLGRFQHRLPKEKAPKGAELTAKPVRKNHILMTAAAEKNASLEIINSLLGKKPRLDLEKAVNREINTEQRERSEEKQKPGKGKGGKKGRRSSIPSKARKGGRVSKARTGKVSIKKARKSGQAEGRKRR